MDEFIDELLKSDRVCDTILPRIQVRVKHVATLVSSKSSGVFGLERGLLWLGNCIPLCHTYNICNIVG